MNNPHYKSKLVVRPLDDGVSWVLEQDFYFTLDNHGLLYAREGFCFDFASIPKILQWFEQPATGKHRYAAFVHDWLCYKGFMTRYEADLVFLKFMKLDGVSWWKRNLMFAAVRLGGWLPWSKRHGDG